MERVSSGTILLAFVAVLCGLLGVFTIRKAFQPREKVEVEPPSQMTVPMASRDLEAGRKITLGDVALMRMTRDQLKKRGIDSLFMGDPEQIIGRTIKSPVARGSTFDTEDFFPDGSGPGISSHLEAGQRAMTVMIFDENALIGFAGAGQLVDVLFRVGGGGGYSGAGSDYTGHPSHRAWQGRTGYHGEYVGNHYGRYSYRHGSSRAVTLMQGVRVLALGDNVVKTQDRARPDEDQPTNVYPVTLAVTPEQAEVLRVVEGHGELSFTLRNPDDADPVELIDSKTLEDILGIEEYRAREMQVYRGQNVRHLIFDRSGPLSHRMVNQRQMSQDAPDKILQQPVVTNQPSTDEGPGTDTAVGEQNDSLSAFIEAPTATLSPPLLEDAAN